MADKDITIGIKTTGAEAAAVEIGKVPVALDEVNDSLDKQGDKFGHASDAAARHTEQLDEISKASRTLVAIQTAEMLKKATGALREATAEGGLLHDQLGDLGPALDTVDNGLDVMSAGLGAFVATGNPVIAVLAGIAAGMAGVADAYAQMQTAQDLADNAKKTADETELKHLRAVKFHKENLSLITQVEGISAENEALAAQEKSLNRMIALREKLVGQANTAARQEVQLAKLKGGDVALAEANVITTELQGALQSLNDKLAGAKQEATAATAREISANKEWQLAQGEVAENIRDLNSADTQKIKAAAESASKKGEESRQKLTDFMVHSENSRREIISKGEISLETKEQEYAGKTSATAKKAFDGVYQTLVAEAAKGPESSRQSIAQIQADGAAVSAAADAKAQEVSASIQSATVGSVQAVQGISSAATAATKDIDAAINGATTQVMEALNLMTNKMVVALAKLAANGIANANRIDQQQAQINQIMARTR